MVADNMQHGLYPVPWRIQNVEPPTLHSPAPMVKIIDPDLDALLIW